MTLRKDQVVNIVKDEIRRSRGSEHDQLSANRERAFDYYYNRDRGDEVAGSSTVQSSDVSDMVEAVNANISPILTEETLVSFEAIGEEDENNAQTETDFVSYMINGQSDGYVEIQSAVKDALLLKNGWLKVFVDEEQSEETDQMSGVSEFQIQARLEESDNETTVEILSIEDDDESGQFNATIKTTIHKRELRVESIDPGNLLYSPEHRSPLLPGIRFIAERKLLTRSELIGMDYPRSLVDALPAMTTDTKIDVSARDDQPDDSSDLATLDAANEEIETYDCHILMDQEESGSTKLRRIHYAENEILLDEVAPWVPYCTGSPFLMPHRLSGLSIFDKLESIQDSKTDSLRQWHSNMRRVNNARLIYNPMSTQEDDVNTSRAGAGIRSKDPAGVGQVQTNDMGASIVAGLQYMDKQREERSGASLDLQGSQLQLAGQVGNQGAAQQIDLKEKLAGQMSRTLANTLIKQLYLLTHKTLREFMPGALTAKLNGKWVETDPSEWAERKKVNVLTGMTSGEKQQRIGALNAVIQQQYQLIGAGKDGEITDDSKLYNAYLDWTRAAKLDNPEQYFIDPSSPEAQQAKQQKQQQQQQAQQAATQQQQQMMEKQSQMQQEMFALQAQLDKYKHDSELVFKYADSALDAEVEEAKLVGSATLQLQQAQDQFDQAAINQEQATAAEAG